MINFRAALEEEAAGEETRQVARSNDQFVTFDLETAKTRFSAYSHKIKNLKAEAEDLEVVDTESNRLAVTIAGHAKKAFKAVDDLRKEIVARPNAFVKSVNTFARVFTTDLGAIEAECKKKISAWMVEEQRKLREAEAKARKEAEALQAKLDAEAKKNKTEPVVQAPVVTRTETGSASLRKSWTWKELDFDAIPNEFKMIDTVKINKAVKAGIRAIPGIEIFEQQTTVIR